ncbi:MAG TPA: 1-deoxy-D-xylulose-5-phosphate synthase N-terminal domain-containing protein [Chthoniobacterales bacterium]|nr:1-deoxy-D-xylulose-5-phosphate synthase N-terminal domain-containing protein [Chthoniobacterales bacterium]
METESSTISRASNCQGDQLVLPHVRPDPARIRVLEELARKVLWLACWMIHHANHIRPNRDGVKVGGHQASSASLVALMTALYLDVLRAQDRIAVKPHASPVYHAIQYLLGKQTREKLEHFRAFGGAQSYPSRTKDTDDVDFSTGSVGLGVAITLMSAIVQEFVQVRQWLPRDRPLGRLVALVGDAELDEGNVFEALFEGWKHDVRNVWWVIDYNRQSLDSVVTDRLFDRIDSLFKTMEWRVVVLKYGKKLQDVFEGEGGSDLKDWLDTCPNSLYSALVYKGGPGWREHLQHDTKRYPGIGRVLEKFDDKGLHELMMNLAGHDMATLLDAFHGVSDDQPTCFIAYTIKGFGLPFAGHKDNHAGLMTLQQMEIFRRTMGIAEGEEWSTVAGLNLPVDEVERLLADVPFAKQQSRTFEAGPVSVPSVPVPGGGEQMSTQQGLGRILSDLAGGHSELADRIVTTSPDVTVSTNLGGWVNRRGVFHRNKLADVFKDENALSLQSWAMSPSGQHLELGIAENNLFLMLGALGLAAPLFGVRLLPIGTVYDPFICRGLDALNYACYQDSRFILVGTPSGVTLAPEGGAHQSTSTPLIGMAQDGLAYFEPAYVDELAAIMEWAFNHLQAPPHQGGSVYLRLSTRPLRQPGRELTDSLREEIITGAYWKVRPMSRAGLAIVYCGAIAREAEEAHAALLDDMPGAGLLAITSPDRLHADWLHHKRLGSVDSHVERLLAPLSPDAILVTVLDGHPATLSWLGSACRRRVRSLGVERFGQSGDTLDLYRAYGIDTEAILDAVAIATVEQWKAG